MITHVRCVLTTASLLLATAAAAGPSAAPPEAEAAAIINDSLVVRLYDTIGLPSGERARAMRNARAIVSAADLDLEWMDCPSRGHGKPASGCAMAPGGGQLVVRLVNAPADEAPVRRAHSLGYSLIDNSTGTGVMATVFVDRVTRLAEAARVDRATVLGRALAHEIGHLILGSNEHSRDGLMREVWTPLQLTSGRAKDWMFLPSQSEQMRQARTMGGSGGATARSGRRPSSGG